MDVVLKLRELRRLSGLSQHDVARLSGVGVKTISSFETGARIDSLKLAQLERILRVYGMSESEFFIDMTDGLVETSEMDGLRDILDDLRDLPAPVQGRLLERFQRMVDEAFTTQSIQPSGYSHREMDWQMLTSRN
jgi:transcriptional regulator with XRE-family HTH domain